MRLEIGQNIDNKRVRLDFRKDNYSAVYMPSYVISKSKADEFISRYNEQDSILQKVTFCSVIGASSFGGFIASHFNRKKLLIPFGILSGVVAGLGLGAAISADKKDDLMTKYNVKELNKD